MFVISYFAKDHLKGNRLQREMEQSQHIKGTTASTTNGFESNKMKYAPKYSFDIAMIGRTGQGPNTGAQPQGGKITATS